MTSVVIPNTGFTGSAVTTARPAITPGVTTIVDAVKAIEDNLDKLNNVVFKSIKVDPNWKISLYAHSKETNYFGKIRLTLFNDGVDINLDLDEDTVEKLIEDLQSHLNYIRDIRSKWYLGELSK